MSRSAAYSAHQPDHHSQYTPTTTSRSCSLSESDYDDDPAVKPNLFCSPCKRPANQRSTPNRTARCDLLCSFSRSVDLLIRMTMGVAEMEVAEHTAAASVEPVAARPARERMFQVVPVPGEFTRGRWKCWDYRERVVEGSNGQATAPATSEPRWGMLLQFDEPDEKENMDTLSDTLTSTSMTTTSTMPIGEGMGGGSGGGQQTGAGGGGGSHGSVPVLHTVTVQSETVADGGQREQSSTILVTSIAPAPPTPLHGTPQSGVEERIAAGVAAGGGAIPVSPLSTSPDVGSGSLAAGMAKNADYNDAMLSPTAALREAAGGGSVTNVAREEMEIPQPPTQQELNGLSCASPIGGRPDDLQMTCSSSLPLGASASTLGAGLTTPLNPHPLGAPRTASTEQASTPVEEDPSSSAVSAIGGANVVAIDNKIEQAMDLVKTHLTFAVREEVEILRSTIVDLEARVAGLEQQNQYLRQFVPAEVLANLAIISRQPPAGTPTHSTPSIAPLPAPKTVPSGTFCPATATLASTLNTVVAEGKSPKMNH